MSEDNPPIARAPGKVVISGAYAVLEGAPAIVSAVSRYARADASRRAELVTPEVREAIESGVAPWFDASELREGDAKLGLGSSAAILVASLGALELSARGRVDDSELCAAVLSRALAAHARAQGGGSGIDVAASSHGGTLVCMRRGELLEVRRVPLPASMVVEVWASGQPASTPDLLRRVGTLRERDPVGHHALLDAQGRASELAAVALERSDAEALLEALAEQRDALARLGAAAGAEIVTPTVSLLDARARTEGGLVIPSGAGGGDIALYLGTSASSPELRALAEGAGHRLLALELEARGVHAEGS